MGRRTFLISSPFCFKFIGIDRIQSTSNDGSIPFVSQFLAKKINCVSFHTQSGIPHGPFAPTRGRHVHFAGPFPKDDGIGECGAQGWSEDKKNIMDENKKFGVVKGTR
jgi:hypothetical protein